MAVKSSSVEAESRCLSYSESEFKEMKLLGLVDERGGRRLGPQSNKVRGVEQVKRSAITSHDVLNEAYEYEKPSSFSRGLRIDLGAVDMLLISGTASIDDQGVTVHVGDFRAQLWRTYRNITRLLEAEGANWHDIVRTSCYLRDIERDYKDFNEVRTAFFNWLRLDPLPASTGIQARLCREDLLVEIEAIAMLPKSR
ncbi:MAG: Rid family hydrolase [Capsulimonadaceae bacterium]|nr:Rid family hydrolase [Capsulimonadaceae bacterium]